VLGGDIRMSVDNLNELGGRQLVIFDGSCGLCNRAVRWFIQRDSHDRLRFAPSDSPRVTEVLARHGFSAQDKEFGPDSIVVVSDVGGAAERVLLRSAAVLALLAELPRPWPGMARVLGWIPHWVCEQGYRLIARWRHRLGEQLDQCAVPTAEERAHLL
jgi:predicted DCC family thiol-disulfide oxidoreductase YuxK